MARLRIVNPLPRTLEHYQRQLEQVLTTVGVTCLPVSSASAEVAGRPWHRLVTAARLLLSRQVSRGRRTVVTWPVFGRADPLTWPRTGGSTTYLIVHDPEPLRRQLGMGRASTALGRRAATGPVQVVVHGESARAAIERLGWPAPTVLPHPMLEPGPLPAAVDRRGLLVIGQWKPARSLAPLDLLAADPVWDGQRAIKGRGWSAVAGWEVDARFLTEAELTAALLASRCVVLPYDRYFQSNIAVRALECLTPVVGRHHPFLADLFGDDWPGLVDHEDWAAAVKGATAVSEDELAGRRQAAWVRCTATWSRWAATLPDPQAPAPRPDQG